MARHPFHDHQPLALIASDGNQVPVPPVDVVCEILLVMLREFDARLEKGDNPGAWTCVVMDDAVALFGTRADW